MTLKPGRLVTQPALFSGQIAARVIFRSERDVIQFAAGKFD